MVSTHSVGVVDVAADLAADVARACAARIASACTSPRRSSSPGSCVGRRLGGGTRSRFTTQHARRVLARPRRASLTIVLNSAENGSHEVVSSLARSSSPPPLHRCAVLLAGCGAFADDAGTTVAGSSRRSTRWSTSPSGWRATTRTVDEPHRSPGSEPHDLELDVAETAALARPTWSCYEHGFQPAVDDAVASADGRLDAADVVDAAARRRPRGGARGRDAEEGHDHGDLDPHFWLDPLLMADLGDAVADELAEVDPDHARRLRRQRRRPARAT